MAIKYLYKCNPLVAEAAKVKRFNRFSWPDGTIMLWEADMVAIDRVRFKLDTDNFLADLGAVKMTDPEAAAEQKNPCIRLPEARLPQFRWVQPDFSKNTEETEEMNIEEVAEKLAEEIAEVVEEAIEADEEGGES